MSVGGGPSLAQQQLAGELARLRSLAGLDQRQIAAHAGISQATVSRIERALKLPTLSNVIAWVNACGATADVVERITTLTEAAHTQVETWRELASRSPHLQDAVRANEATAARLRAYSPTVVPGLLQTAAYARRTLALTDATGQLDVAAGVEGRLRRQEALHDPIRHFEFLITETALRLTLGTPAGHAAQLDRIVSL
ncbi:MAG: Scr1 family TA system antitoxin-like transcriptional regulator, partial [Gammaproteobacteria bacterium]